MAKAVLVLGDSGSGKSFMHKNMDPKEHLILTPNDKDLPWRGAAAAWGSRMRKTLKFANVVVDLEALKKAPPSLKYVTIEDLNHLFNNEMYSQEFAIGDPFQRWAKLGREAAQMILKINELPKHMIVFIMAHTEDKSGRKVIQLHGKLLENNVKPEGWVETVLHAVPAPGKDKLSERFVLITHDDGIHMAKSPEGMFLTDTIPNDMKIVVEAIQAHYAATA